MDYKQHLFFGLGQVAYAIAMSDGKIQKEEKEKLDSILLEEIARFDQDFDFSDTIFKILEKDHANSKDAYNWGIHAIQTGSSQLTPELAEEFLRIIKNVILAFPPPEKSELNLFEKFETDLMILVK